LVGRLKKNKNVLKKERKKEREREREREREKLLCLWVPLSWKPQRIHLPNTGVATTKSSWLANTWRGQPALSEEGGAMVKPTPTTTGTFSFLSELLLLGLY
jgi:hypothetical protein